MQFFFTFGSNHLDRKGNRLTHAYFVIAAETETEARTKMFHLRQNKWAFCYTKNGFKGQVEKYGLHEITLTDL